PERSRRSRQPAGRCRRARAGLASTPVGRLAPRKPRAWGTARITFANVGATFVYTSLPAFVSKGANVSWYSAPCVPAVYSARKSDVHAIPCAFDHCDRAVGLGH